MQSTIAGRFICVTALLGLIALASCRTVAGNTSDGTSADGSFDEATTTEVPQAEVGLEAQEEELLNELRSFASRYKALSGSLDKEAVFRGTPGAFLHCVAGFENTSAEQVQAVTQWFASMHLQTEEDGSQNLRLFPLAPSSGTMREVQPERFNFQSVSTNRMLFAGNQEVLELAPMEEDKFAIKITSQELTGLTGHLGDYVQVVYCQ